MASDALTSRLGRTLAAVALAIDRLPGPGMVIGGIATIVRGVPRATRDVDFTVSGGHASVASILERLTPLGLAPRVEDAERFAEANQVILLQHRATGVEVDLSLAWLSFEQEAIAAAELLEVGGVRVRVARAEDLVVYKALAWRPQDQQDVQRLIALHGRTMDRDRVLNVVAELAEALDEPERVDALQQLFARLTGRR